MTLFQQPLAKKVLLQCLPRLVPFTCQDWRLQLQSQKLAPTKTYLDRRKQIDSR